MRREAFAALACAAAAAGSLARCGCDDPLTDLQPVVVVTPDRIDFGERDVGVASDAAYTIANDGAARLHVVGVAIDGATSGADDVFQALPVPSDIEVRKSAAGTLRFTPPARGAYEATLVVTTDDPERREVRVPITGVGGPPRIAAAPSPVDFGVVNEGPGAVQTVLLTNTGHDVLSIASLALRDGDQGYALPDDFATTATLAPRASLPVPITLAPRRAAVLATTDGVLRDALIVVSDAENAPNLEVPLQATANLAPIAVAVELVTRRAAYKTGPGREVTVDGNETVDPEGDAFTFAWTLIEAPAGSASFLVGTALGPTCADDAACDAAAGYRCTDTGTVRCRQVARTRVTPDLVGRYVVRLRATDVHGAYGEADFTILPRDLAVVLSWIAEPNSPCAQYSDAECAALDPAERLTLCCGQNDLDLHLLRPTGALGDYGTCPVECTVQTDAGVVNRCIEDGDAHVDTCRQAGTDAAYANRYPEWGATGRVDDPRLDVDDVRGLGPEVVTLDQPADGEYVVVVHYCTDRLEDEDAVARVQIYVEGELVSTAGPQLLDVEDEAWEAVRMVRSGGPADGGWVVTPQLNAFQTAPVGLCTQTP